MTRDYYELPESGKIMRFLWKCAGGDRYLLERATYSDQIKYMCLGGIVFATGAMAALAGGYAFHTIFSPRGNAIESIKQKYANSNPEVIAQMTKEAINNIHQQEILVPILSILFGIIWGLIIFNIDRFIVTSTGKGDGTEKITMDEIKGAIPRIIMGMIIALTISKPVEIRMFQSEIDSKLYEKQIEQKQIYINKIDSTFNKDINLKNEEIKVFLIRKADLEKICDTLKSRIDYQIANGGCKGKCEEYKIQLINNQNEISKIENNSDYLRVKKEKLKLEKDRELKLNDADKVSKGLDGLVERIKLADEVCVNKKGDFPWISFFITLLFMAIELTPIFFKLMLTKSTYDYLTENRDELIKAERGIEVKYDYYKDKQGVEKHLVINHEAEKLIYEKMMVTNIQKELTDYAVQKYKEREMKKIDENLDTYIKTINKNEQNS